MIKLDKLTTGYTTQGALKEISKELNLTIEKGSLVGILGCNGIGKSTLLKTIAGFESPLSGSVQINNQMIHEMGPKNRAQNLSVVLTERTLSSDSVSYTHLTLPTKA